LKKSSPFNPSEKAVPIQPSWKSRLHSTQSKKSITQLRSSSSCVDHWVQFN
jgi:hypothetical protein